MIPSTASSTRISWPCEQALARTRPHTRRWYDTVVRALAGPRRSWWECVARYFQDRDRVQRLEAARQDAGQPGVPLLRVLDIAVWMPAH